MNYGMFCISIMQSRMRVRAYTQRSGGFYEWAIPTLKIYEGKLFRILVYVGIYF